MSDVALSQVVVQYNEEVRDPGLKKLLKQDWRSRWGYVTTEVFDKYKKMRRGEMCEQEAEERFIVYLPDGTLATVALVHMSIVDSFAMVELMKRMNQQTNTVPMRPRIVETDAEILEDDVVVESEEESEKE